MPGGVIPQKHVRNVIASQDAKINFSVVLATDLFICIK